MPAAGRSSEVLLFVYGSLKRGFRHHAELRGAPRERPARTLGRYRLVRVGEYPALLEGGEQRVSGELYRVGEELLAELDEFEGPAYRRGSIVLEDGSEAVAYLGDPALSDLPVIDGGVWRE